MFYVTFHTVLVSSAHTPLGSPCSWSFGAAAFLHSQQRIILGSVEGRPRMIWYPGISWGSADRTPQIRTWGCHFTLTNQVSWNRRLLSYRCRPINVVRKFLISRWEPLAPKPAARDGQLGYPGSQETDNRSHCLAQGGWGSKWSLEITSTRKYAKMTKRLLQNKHYLSLPISPPSLSEQYSGSPGYTYMLHELRSNFTTGWDKCERIDRCSVSKSDVSFTLDAWGH